MSHPALSELLTEEDQKVPYHLYLCFAEEDQQSALNFPVSIYEFSTSWIILHFVNWEFSESSSQFKPLICQHKFVLATQKELILATSKFFYSQPLL